MRRWGQDLKNVSVQQGHHIPDVWHSRMEEYFKNRSDEKSKLLGLRGFLHLPLPLGPQDEHRRQMWYEHAFSRMDLVYCCVVLLWTSILDGWPFPLRSFDLNSQKERGSEGELRVRMGRDGCSLCTFYGDLEWVKVPSGALWLFIPFTYPSWI